MPCARASPLEPPQRTVVAITAHELESRPPIVLIHGLWMTPASWTRWAERFRRLGHDVHAPAWPGIGSLTPAELRADPRSIEDIGLLDVVSHLERVVRGLDRAPIIMGHSFGGIFTQMLLDRGLGVAGAAIEPGTTAGVLTLPLSTLRVGAPVLTNPFRRRRASAITRARFHYAFANDLTRAQSDEEWERSAIPSFNRLFFDGVLALPRARSGVTRVSFGKPDRAPLLLIAGENDHVAPPALQRALLRHYAAGASTVGYQEFPGRTHGIVRQRGWEEVADFALAWTLRHAANRDSQDLA